MKSLALRKFILMAASGLANGTLPSSQYLSYSKVRWGQIKQINNYIETRRSYPQYLTH